MARSRETKIELTAYDDLFQTDESREEAKLSKIRDIPISEIDEFPDHPFKVLMDEDMEQLVESIKRNGVMTPATVRLKEDGRYELISGHRRKKACELAGLETLKCEVKELTRDEAIIVMVESNLQRSVILPSEKAFAYKMRLEAMKRQAGRPPKENASPLATNLSKGRSKYQRKPFSRCFLFSAVLPAEYKTHSHRPQTYGTYNFPFRLRYSRRYSHWNCTSSHCRCCHRCGKRKSSRCHPQQTPSQALWIMP